MNRLYLLIALASVLVALVVCALTGEPTEGLLGLATALVGALAGATWPASTSPGSDAPTPTNAQPPAP